MYSDCSECARTATGSHHQAALKATMSWLCQSRSPTIPGVQSTAALTTDYACCTHSRQMSCAAYTDVGAHAILELKLASDNGGQGGANDCYPGAERRHSCKLHTWKKDSKTLVASYGRFSGNSILPWTPDCDEALCVRLGHCVGVAVDCIVRLAQTFNALTMCVRHAGVIRQQDCILCHTCMALHLAKPAKVVTHRPRNGKDKLNC